MVSRDLGFVHFADDTNLFAEDKDPVELYGRVNVGLGKLDRWFRCNMLTLNLKKDGVRVFLGAERAGGATRGPHDRGRERKMGRRGPVSWGVGG